MAVNAPFCWFLLQSHGLVGGAWALIASECALLLFNIFASPWARRQIHVLFGKPLLLSAISLVAFFVLRVWMPSGAAFGIAISLYGILVWRASLVDVSLLKRFIV